MDVAAWTASISHAFAALHGADARIVTVAVVLGALGGWYLGSFGDELQERRARAARLIDSTRRERR
jgi:hypothetical protein